MIEILPTTCHVDSRLGDLADALDLTIVERNTATPAFPTAQAWRTLTEGDLIRVRLGLRDLGFDDYGTFRVDRCELAPDGRSLVTRIGARDQAALLVEERWREYASFGAWGENPTEKSHPRARALAARIAARVGLELVWESPDYALKQFAIQPEESASQALSRLLEPLRQTRRYRTDAWVDGDSLIVRRRGYEANAGSIDCSLGMVRSIRRQRQPQVGEITVYGATYVYLTVYDTTHEEVHETGADQSGAPRTSVRVTESSPTHRVVETGTEIDGQWVLASRTTEDDTFEDVADGDRWLGRVLVKSTIEEQTNLSADHPTHRVKIIRYEHDSSWRLVLKDEQERQRDENGDLSIFRSHTVIEYRQHSPTHVRTVTRKLDPDGNVFATDYQDAPGQLQSSVHAAAPHDSKWQENQDGSIPTQVKGQEYTDQYEAIADGGGTLPRVYRNENLYEQAICSTIAGDLAAESAAWLYTVTLTWLRPFPYRKGQTVTLTDLPGGCPDLTGVIAGMVTDFDEGRAQWTHEVTVECWRDL